jgi:hypothetical protein
MLYKKYNLSKSFRNICLFIAFVFILKISVFAQNNIVEVEYNFKSGSLGWTAGFADYPPNIGTGYELDAGLRFMPRKLTRLPRQGFYIQGHNRSADLFMYLKRRLRAEDGIVANQTYRVEYVITLASTAATGCGGIGGAPGESVFLKAGASPIEPLSVVQPNGYLRMNVDIGSQINSGTAASVAGNIANGIPCEQAFPVLPFALFQRSHQHTSNVTASAAGELWLLVGTDAGFEGLTRLFYQSIRVRLVPV